MKLPPTKLSRCDARQAVKALLVATEFLEAQIAELQAAVSNGFARGKFEWVPLDRKDCRTSDFSYRATLLVNRTPK